MPPELPTSIATSNQFGDLSGVGVAAYENPYDALIEACRNDPVQPPSLSFSR
jgi:hypothetical protein